MEVPEESPRPENASLGSYGRWSDIKIRQDETFVSDSWTSSSLSSPRTHLNKGFNRRLMSRGRERERKRGKVSG